MKFYILIIFCLLLLKFGLTQEYHPLVEENKKWYILETGLANYYQSSIYKCESDTVIGQEIYQIVYISGDESPEIWSKFGFIKEDENHKVYFSLYRPDQPSYFEPELLYDFSAQINDSLSITSILYNEPYPLDIVITAIDSVWVEGSFRKRTWYDCAYQDNYWIEGIGSNNGLVALGFYCAIACPTCDLQCVKYQDLTIYPDGFTGSCFYVGIDDYSIESEKFKVGPNPSSDFFFVIPQTQEKSLILFELYNSMGEKVNEVKLNDSPTTPIKINTFESGIYLYLITDENKVLQQGKLIVK